MFGILPASVKGQNSIRGLERSDLRQDVCDASRHLSFVILTSPLCFFGSMTSSGPDRLIKPLFLHYLPLQNAFIPLCSIAQLSWIEKFSTHSLTRLSRILLPNCASACVLTARVKGQLSRGFLLIVLSTFFSSPHLNKRRAAGRSCKHHLDPPDVRASATFSANASRQREGALTYSHVPQGSI